MTSVGGIKGVSERMSNAKTTTVGILVVVAAVSTLLAHGFSGGITVADVQNLVSALTGVGLVLAQDAK